MKHFTKIPSLIQIFLAEWLAVMFLFPIASKIYEWFNPAVGYKSQPLDIADYVFLVIGLLLYFWLLHEILRPKINTDSWVSFKTASNSGGDYSFSSTHPSYVFVDILACGFWLFVRWAWSEGWPERSYQGTILIALAAVIPALRLISWYVLRLRPRNRKEVRSSWKPVALLYGLFLAIALVTTIPVLFMQRRQNREQQQKEANLTSVGTGNWKGSETFDALRDPDHNFHGQIGTRVIRLRANQKSSAGMTCTNNAGQGEFATVLATLARYDDVLIFSRIDPGGLVQRAQGNEGKPFEVMGRLTQMPSRIPAWKKYCGLEELSPRPRWVFEKELP